MDYVRRAEITRDIKLDTVEEAFTSRNWIVRIYKVRRDCGTCGERCARGTALTLHSALSCFARAPPQVKDLDVLGRNMTLAARYESRDREAETLRKEALKGIKRRAQLVA